MLGLNTPVKQNVVDYASKPYAETYSEGLMFLLANLILHPQMARSYKIPFRIIHTMHGRWGATQPGLNPPLPSSTEGTRVKCSKQTPSHRGYSIGMHTIASPSGSRSLISFGFFAYALDAPSGQVLGIAPTALQVPGLPFLSTSPVSPFGSDADLAFLPIVMFSMKVT